jgi:hypothetical protein
MCGAWAVTPNLSGGQGSVTLVSETGHTVVKSSKEKLSPTGKRCLGNEGRGGEGENREKCEEQDGKHGGLIVHPIRLPVLWIE